MSSSPRDLIDFQNAFAESLTACLNLNTWRPAPDLAAEYQRIEQQVQAAVEAETEYQRYIRERVHPLLALAKDAPPGAGVHAVPLQELLEVQRGLLFNGAVEACDGSHQAHDTLALTIHQIGVSLVSFQGERDSFQTRLFRRDLRMQGSDPAASVMDLLQRRAERGALDQSTPDPLSELAQRGLMAYAERAVLADRATSPWRMGHGSPAPLELIVSYFTDMVIESLRVIRRLIDHQRFVFVASEPADRALLTIGQGLRPQEYAIVGTLRDRIIQPLELWTVRHAPTVSTEWDGVTLSPREWMMRFRDEVAPKVVYGLYRATPLAPPQLFYAHVNHSSTAVRIAMADSLHLEERGFPLLIDLADRTCKTIYGGSNLHEIAGAAYAASGAPFRYQSERPSRPS